MAHKVELSLRRDLAQIAELVTGGSRVLDIGCGDGALLEYLATHFQVDGRGMELSQAGVNACVARGLSVVQGDADLDLASYPTHGFDYAILSQTIQATKYPDRVLAELVRIGRRAIVSLPNFGHWRIRNQVLWRGRMPRTMTLGYEWYDTPNIHLCTLADFKDLCQKLNITIERFIPCHRDGQAMMMSLARLPIFANLLADQAVFVLSQNAEPPP
ncbi:MAG: methionine biosynthesis protein MetW [Alphaproteobacteria bacterium]|nr:methionine biosynthesis protein MetW [Alphaproteobacteria bacterium]